MILVHVFVFLVSIGILWFFGGLLVEAVHRVADHLKQSSFTVAFFVLGFMTSITEISVAVSSSINGTPQVSAGNLAGASIVILLCIIPLLAIIGRKIHLKNTLNEAQLFIALVIIASPIVFLLDGSITSNEGVVCLLLYLILPYSMHKVASQTPKTIIKEVRQELLHKETARLYDFAKILVAGACIFVAGYFLVDEAVYFAELLSIPRSIIGLLVLSIGTNIPELVVAVRAIGKGKTEIAFGDYLGSATANTFIFSILAVINGTFTVTGSEFRFTALFALVGFTLFYVFSRSKNTLTRKEGLALISVYALFIVFEGTRMVMNAIG